MTHYLAACWEPENTLAADRVLAFELSGQRGLDGFQVVLRRPGCLVAVWGPRPTRISRFLEGQALVIGDLFDKDQARSGECGSEGFVASPVNFPGLCADLARNAWGAYVALYWDAADQALSAFRDPIGGIDCIAWDGDGMRVVTSDAGACCLLLPHRAAIDWDCLSRMIANPSLIAQRAPLLAVFTIEAGCLMTMGNAGVTRRQLWSARAICDDGRHSAIGAESLRKLARGCIAAWAHKTDTSLLEVSGGLDSAIVAACLHGKGRPPVAGYHFFARTPGGDERGYANTVAAHFGYFLIETELHTGLSLSDLDDLPVGNRPSIGGLGLFQDRELARRAFDLRADTLFTGQGGDALFFQHPARELARDVRGSAREQLRALMALAQWTGTSVWPVLSERIGLGLWRHHQDGNQRSGLFTRSHAAYEANDGWTGELRSVPSSKRMHVEALALARLAFGTSWTTRTMRVVHPLLSQPLVEAVLATPVLELTQGMRDRGMARRAFACDLPADVIDRRGKGSLVGFFGQSLARSLPFVREYLLGGLLSEHGVFNRYRLETVLDEDYLMQFDVYSEILWLLVGEHWARSWTDLITSRNRDAQSGSHIYSSGERYVASHAETLS